MLLDFSSFLSLDVGVKATHFFQVEDLVRNRLIFLLQFITPAVVGREIFFGDTTVMDYYARNSAL